MNKQHFAIIVVMLAVTLLISAVAIAPAWAKGDGNTIVKEKNEGKTAIFNTGAKTTSIQEN